MGGRAREADDWLATTLRLLMDAKLTSQHPVSEHPRPPTDAHYETENVCLRAALHSVWSAQISAVNISLIHLASLQQKVFSISLNFARMP